MPMESIHKQTSGLEAFANCFQRMGDTAADDGERAAMYLVARSIRNVAAYAIAAGHARLHRAEMERRAGAPCVSPST